MTEEFPETVVTRDDETGWAHYDFSAYRETATFPREWIDSFERYFNEGIETGSFLRGLLENDLFAVIRRAVPFVSAVDLNEALDMLIEGAPANAWGNREKVEAWLADFERRWEIREAKS